MSNKLILKKALAKEVLLIFSTLVLTGLIWVFLLIQNSYYDNKKNSFQRKLDLIISQIDTISTDKIKDLYDGIKKDFVRKYIVNSSEYLIPTKEEQAFLKDFPSAKLLSPNIKGYELYNPKDPLKILGVKVIFPDGSTADVKESDLPSAIKAGAKLYSNIVFNYVELSKFKDLIVDSDYKAKLYSTFSKDYDMETQLSYESKINSGLKFNNESAIRKQRLLEEKQTIEDELQNSNRNIRDDKEVWRVLIWTFVILAIIIYPVRLSFLLLRWSIRTVRQKTI